MLEQAILLLQELCENNVQYIPISLGISFFAVMQTPAKKKSLVLNNGLFLKIMVYRWPITVRASEMSAKTKGSRKRDS